MFIINEGELGFYAEKIVPKLWGVEYWIVNTEKYCLKFLKIIPGVQCSIHCHQKKDETFVGVSGYVILSFHNSVTKEQTGGEGIGPGDTFQILPGQYHSFYANNVSWVMEVSTHHDDEDVVRIQESRKLYE
jgi:D-lyxose ketol-isomerase